MLKFRSLEFFKLSNVFLETKCHLCHQRALWIPVTRENCPCNTQLSARPGKRKPGRGELYIPPNIYQISSLQSGSLARSSHTQSWAWYPDSTNPQQRPIDRLTCFLRQQLYYSYHVWLQIKLILWRLQTLIFLTLLLWDKACICILQYEFVFFLRCWRENSSRIYNFTITQFIIHTQME